MRNWILRYVVVLALTVAAAAEAKLNVVATLPDFAAIAREVGGDHINVTSLARGAEDPHFVDARPSFIRVLNKADILIEGGADLEIGWLPPLVENARNKKILPGAAGRVDASRGIVMMDVPVGKVDRSEGDVHNKGNPHFWLDPANGSIIATNLATVFSRMDPDHAGEFKANLVAFDAKLKRRMASWTRRLAPYNGTTVLTYHKTFEYFARRFGLKILDQLEPKPGIEPTPNHVASLIPRARQARVKLVLIEPFRSRRTPRHIAEAVDAKLVLMPDKVGSLSKIKDYFDLMDVAVKEIADALD